MSMNVKQEAGNFCHRIKYHVLLSLLVFFAFTLMAYFYPTFFQSIMQPVVQGMSKNVKSGQLVLATIPLFLNNFSVALKMFEGGMLLSIPTVYLLAYNGILIGFTGAHLPLTYFLSYTVPHGIFELTAIILAGAAGFRLTQAIINVLAGIKIRGINKSDIFVDHLTISVKMLIDAVVIIVIVAILLIIAAFVEANLTIPLGSSIMSI